MYEEDINGNTLPFIKSVEIHLQVNNESTVQKEVFGRCFNKNDILGDIRFPLTPGARYSYMNNNGIRLTDLDHMLNIVFFNHWAAIGRMEQQTNIVDMEGTPLFGIPTSTTITTPVNNGTDVDKTVNIQWKNAFAANQYRLQIAEDDQFTNISVENLVYRKDTLLTLLEGKDYYARVRTENDKGISNWSPTIHSKTKSIITGVNDNLMLDYLKIYPNPAINYFIIDLEQYYCTLDYSVKIVNMLGKTVFETKVTKPKYEINTSNWTGKGTYVLQIFNSKKILKASKKIILH
jgi:hypothetical protein